MADGDCQVWRRRRAVAAGPSSERAARVGQPSTAHSAMPNFLCQTFGEPPAACDGPSEASAEPATRAFSAVRSTHADDMAIGRWPFRIGCWLLRRLARLLRPFAAIVTSAGLRPCASTHPMSWSSGRWPFRIVQHRKMSHPVRCSIGTMSHLPLAVGRRPWRDCCFLQWT